MDEKQRRVDDIRRARSEVENHLIDEYAARKISRKEFVRRGTVVGMSIPLLGFLASACGGGDEEAAPTPPAGTGAATGAAPPAAPAGGGTVRVALITPTTEPNPLLVQDEGGAGVLGATGEFLSFSDQNLELQPRLAESWAPNDDGTVWTFTIRQGVTFHDGTPLTANDIVTTFDKLIDPDKGSANARSALGGVLSPGSIEAPDDATVVFTLDAANGNFPTLVSSANYNAIIIPAALDPADWGQTFMGTGAFKFESFTPKVGFTVVRNDDYWGTKALPDKMEVKFYDEEAAMVLALQGDEVDFVEHFSVAGGKALLDDPNVQVISIRTATHRQLHMRTDKEPFTDKRVRQAIAQAINRQSVIDGVLFGLGRPATQPVPPESWAYNPDVPGFGYNPGKAKALLAEAGWKDTNGDGVLDKDGRPFQFTIITNQGNEERAKTAAIIQQDLSRVGIKVEIRILEWQAFLHQFIDKKKFEAIILGWSLGRDPDSYDIWHSSKTKEGQFNFVSYSNPEVDKLLLEGRNTCDQEKRKQIYAKLHAMIAEDQPYTFLYYPDALHVLHKRFKGVSPSPIGIWYNFPTEWHVPKNKAEWYP